MSAAHKTLRAKSIVLLKRPVGMPSPVLGETIGLRESDVPGEAPADGLLVHLGYFSVDPYLRGVLGNTPDNTIINGYVAGTVLESKLGEWKKGDLFGANLPFTTYQALTKAQLGTFRKLTDYVSPSELSLAIGLLGMPGSTAYAGLDLMGVGENDRVWISAATGAVGSVAGQIAKNVRKAKLVIGSAGSAEKCATAVKEFGFDACFNYKDAKNATELTSLVKKHAPEGIDFYFENVGGDHFAAAMSNLRPHGRVSVCGAISRYNTTEATLPSEPLSFGQIIYKQQRVEGFLCTDWLMGKRGNFIEDMSKWHKAGIVNSKETVFEGVEKWPEAFHALFIQGGENLGKIVVKIQD